MQSQRLHIIIQGQVQGVGFRPHVYRTANQLNLTGWVNNTAEGVVIEVQGQSVAHFIANLTEQLPPLCKINDIQTAKLALIIEENEFKIISSKPGKVQTSISPDTCICTDCLNELLNLKNHYFHYPFLNCTQCGPRLTITHSLPYDRSQTSMNTFPLCNECQRDYLDPSNRRYHAQPTACASCGPQMRILSIYDYCERSDDNIIKEMAQQIMQGKIIALKGLGGYQLICDAKNEVSISELRERKKRNAKPFAIMVADIQSAKKIAEISRDEEALLLNSARPIVLLKKITASLPPTIAPGLSQIGIMLPSTPLHYLLFDAFSGKNKPLLIVTSGNSGGNPLVIDDESVRSELGAIADTIVSYNREIVTRVDDSVVFLINESPVFIRRARGYVPNPIKLAHTIAPTLAVGGHLKNTFCITRGDEAFVSQHIGSLNNKASIEFFHEALDHLLKLLDVKPERIAHDSHPDFYTTHFAQNYGIPDFAIQHHHAHLASVAAEYGLNEPLLGLALDGYGYGLAGEAWGGELLLLEKTSFERLGSFKPLGQPGGDVAAHEPWRMAASVLHDLGRSSEIGKRFFAMRYVDGVQCMLDKKINTPPTSSCGRLFDAASALLNIQLISQYEGQAAMRLESLVTSPEILANGWRIVDKHFDMTPTLDYLADIADPVTGANLFHGSLIAGLCAWITGIAREKKISKVLLSGGCFLNKVLAEGLILALQAEGIEPYLPRQLPPNDGGISLGQAWIAGRL